MKEKTELNINQFISFNLTSKGEGYINNSNGVGEVYNSPLSDYRYSASVRDVMSVFGSALFVGALPVLEDNLFFDASYGKMVSLNDIATFKLSGDGARLLQEFCEKEMEDFKTPNKRPVKVNEDNVITMTVHEFFYVFGKILPKTNSEIIVGNTATIEIG